MKLGLVFPQTEFGNDPAAIRDYAQTAEELGFHHILAYDHVLGANPKEYAPWKGPYTYENPFHEPFLLYSFMAAVTETVEFVTAILILPQRQTALVAKQAAELDVLSGGRLRLGVGIGWNKVEYMALGQDFHTRGRRIEEQVTLLRQLWSRPLVTFQGEWDAVVEAGLNPLPVRRSIPIWFGGRADAVIRRVARMGDGWLPGFRSAAEAVPALEKLAAYREEAGRPPEAIGLEPRISYGKGDPEAWLNQIEAWAAVGATHLSVNNMYLGFSSPAEHLAAMEKFARAVGLASA